MSVLADELGSAGREALQEGRRGQWPDPQWSQRPADFARLVLGVEPWGYQLDVLKRIARGARHTAIAGGRKVGKDWIGAVAALLWYASKVDGRAILYGPTMKQINRIMWRQIRALWAGHGRCVDCKRAGLLARPCAHSSLMTGKIGISAETGLVAGDGREIIGMVGVNDGGLVGFSGPQLAIQDEASRMKDSVDEAIVGNLASSGSARLAIANPSRTRGFFYDLFHRNRALCGIDGLFQISSETSPNIVERRIVHPDLASLEWLAERELAWGRGSAPWMWHVEGQFLRAEAGQLFAVDAITEAECRWDEGDETSQEGRLYIGLDVAGDGNDGDETAFAPRRGARCLEIDAARGLSPDVILVRALGHVAKWRRIGDRGETRPIIVVDADGETGWRVFQVFHGYERDHAEEIKVVAFHGSHRPKGILGEQYKLNRDLLYGGLVDWMNGGGQIPQNLQLQSDLVVLRWFDVERGQRSLVHKSVIREELQGRSTDRGDAVALSTWGARDETTAWATPTRAPAAAPSPYTRGRADDAETRRYLSEGYGIPQPRRR